MAPRTIEVWDWPVRLFHWLLLALVVGSVVSVKIGGGAMVWHGRFGQAILGLVVFRVVWGLIGSRTARFASFVRGPRAIADYLAGRWRGVGHNPLGALSVLAMLAVIGFQAATGLFAYDDIAYRGPMAPAVAGAVVDRLSGWHRLGQWALFAVVALHLAAVLWYVLVRRETLVRPMLTGRKEVGAG
ncbi:MAG: cytochrome b/b6 domain-containing protein, partial [Rhodocyclaceae bacterium]|nr:cytochrome b/b6 domain-containing protein [Rhodocyclaceae bacterium]